MVQMMVIKIAEVFYTLSEAAERLSVERHTVWRWIRAGRLEAQKVGGTVLIERAAVEALRVAGQLPS